MNCPPIEEEPPLSWSILPILYVGLLFNYNYKLKINSLSLSIFNYLHEKLKHPLEGVTAATATNDPQQTVSFRWSDLDI